MLKRPLFSVAVAFALGIILSGVFGLPWAVSVATLAFAACACFVARQATFAVLCIVAALGIARYESFTAVPPDDVSRFAYTRASAVHGQIRSDIDRREDKAFIPLDVSAVEVDGRLIPASGKLMLTCYRPTDAPDWQPPTYGDLLRVRCRISRPSESSNDGGFSWRQYLSRQGMHAVAYVRDPEQMSVRANRPSNPVMALALRAREGLAASIFQAMPQEEASVVAGMALGTYSTLPDRILTNFTRTGTLHMLAASGFNCAVIIVVFGFLLTKVLRLPKRTSNLLLMALLIFYMMMVGAKPSIVRATIMAGLVLFGALIYRPADTLNLLFAAALVILAIKPTDIFDVGFQLSFAAVMALVVVLPTIEEVAERWRMEAPKTNWRQDWQRRLTHAVTRDTWQGVTATAAATLGTLPLSMHYFNQLSLVSIVVNVIVASAVLPIFVIGLLTPMFSHVPLLGEALAWLGTLITSCALSAINWFGELPGSSLNVASPGIAGVLGYYLLLSVGINYASSRVREKQRKSGA